MQPNVEILNQEIDRAGPSFYRMLVEGRRFVYLTIDPEIYDTDDLCFPPILLTKLPTFPEGDWNYGRISQAPGHDSPYFAEVLSLELPSITPLWHTESYDYLSLTIGERLKAHVYLASSPQFVSPVVAKFARFEWEIDYYIAETQAYSWIDGHGIAPAFLGYLTENGRVIGFLIEHIVGRRADISDLQVCREAVQRLHRLGIVHGDLSRGNFLITGEKAVIIDFETAKKSDDSRAMDLEIEGLTKHLSEEDSDED